MTGICKICCKAKKLCKAHISPKGLKKLLTYYGTDNYFHGITNEGNSCKLQDIEWDGNIICADCDNLLGTYDEALIKMIKEYYLDPGRNLSKTDEKYRVLEFRLNSEKLILGIIALLFRASLTNRVETVNLGKKYTQIFSEWLASGKRPANQRHFFEVVAVGSKKDKKNVDGTLSPFPKYCPYNGLHLYMMNIFGFILIMKVGNGVWNTDLGKFPRLNEYENKILVPLTEFREMPFYEEIIDSLKRRNDK